ncbi:Os01g0721750 [Oryza sativa Japonica Group]|uniref:Os01g0721750 protein n=1 Tax=Oryza sativa subsp. japonica TaxID=39947 RepID=A0A0N7KDN2_ORYSJ|nr:Os01g0721750 [Oryza sativa Japonica Group]
MVNCCEGSCKSGISGRIARASGTCDNQADKLPEYRRITRVIIRNGRRSSFWLDVWHGNAPLSQSFPALLSHSTRQHCSVRQVKQAGLPLGLTPRLSSAAREDLAEVQDIIQQLELSSGMDQRIYSPNGHSETFSSSSLYQFLSSSNLPNCANWDFVWNNAALPRVQFFA